MERAWRETQTCSSFGAAWQLDTRRRLLPSSTPCTAEHHQRGQQQYRTVVCDWKWGSITTAAAAVIVMQTCSTWQPCLPPATTTELAAAEADNLATGAILSFLECTEGSREPDLLTTSSSNCVPPPAAYYSCRLSEAMITCIALIASLPRPRSDPYRSSDPSELLSLVKPT